MSGAFFDTNILIYLFSDDSAKAAMSERVTADGGTVSVQVLNEFAWVFSRKLKKSIAEIRHHLATVRAFCDVLPVDIETHELALDIAERYRFAFYDSVLLAAASRANCHTFYTEDLQHNQRIEGLTIRNPFIS